MEGYKMTGLEMGLVVVGGTLVLPLVAGFAILGVMYVFQVTAGAINTVVALGETVATGVGVM